MHRPISSLVLLLSVCVAWAHAQPRQDTFTFGVVADVQYCACDAHGSRYYRSSLDKLAGAVEAFNQERPEFVVQLGDLIDRGAKSYDGVLAVLGRLEAPTHHVLGNHDFALGEDNRLDHRARVLQILGLDRAYYAFRHGGWRFVVLDGNDISLYATAREGEDRRRAEDLLAALRESGADNAQTWNGGLGAKQLMWLKRILAESDAADERVVIFSHFPVYPRDAHNLWNDGALLALMDAHPSVAAYISGHNHAGGYTVRRNVHFLTLHGMVETPSTTAFALIDVSPRGLRVRGWGREPDRMLEVRISGRGARKP